MGPNRWSPKHKFAEVELNGVYQGLYSIQEKIKRDKHRVNITKVGNCEDEGNSGGYLLEFGWMPAWPVVGWGIEYPRDVDNASANWILNEVHEVFNESAGVDYSRIDLDSAYDFFLLQEMTGNT